MRRAPAVVGAALLLGLLSGSAAAEPYPAPDGYVVDSAGVVPAAVEATLEAELRAYDKRTGEQVAVLVVRSLDGETVEDYARTVFNQWALGQAAQDNGVLLLLAVDDRRSRIQVGYGLEGRLTDDRTQRILTEVVAPSARARNYAGAVQKGERAVRAALDETRGDAPSAPVDAPDDFVPVPAMTPTGSGPSTALLVAPVVVIGIAMVAAFGYVAGRAGGAGRGRRRAFGTGAFLGSTGQTDDSWRSTSSGLGSGWDSGSSGSSGGSVGGGGSSGDGGSSGSW